MSSINEANNTEIPSQNTGGNLNDGKNSNSKKKEQAPKETFYNLCHSLLRFINRRIVKKYVFPNEAQLPKERRGLDLRANNDWKYYLNKDVTEDEKIKDVFKDDKFLGSLQKMTNSLNEIIDFMDMNQKQINMIEEKSRNKEEKINSLSEIKDLLNTFFDPKKENINDDKSFNNILEKINHFNSLQKNINKTPENKNNNSNNNMIEDNMNENEDFTIKEEASPLIKNNESDDNEQKNFIKNELNILKENFRLDDLKDSAQSLSKISQEKKEDIKNENIFINRKTEREKTTKKNKKKKNQNKTKMEKKENDIDVKNNDILNNTPPIKSLKIPILLPKEDKSAINKTDKKDKKKKESIDEEILRQLIDNESLENSKENNVNKNKVEKKEVINIESIPNNTNKSAEEIFESELKKNFAELQKDKKNKMIIKMKSIIQTLDDTNILDIKKYNDRITGPFLAGSYKTFQDLCYVEYPREIDIIYKYKNMLLNKDIKDFSVKEVLENYLELNIVKSCDICEDENNRISKIEVECSDKKLGNNDIIKFNVIFVDIGYGFNEKIIDDLILNKKEFLVKTEGDKFMNICLFLRIWRRKNKLFYLIPEMLDELARKFLSQEKSMLTVVLNVFYDLYNENNDFYPKGNNDFISKQKIICEKLMSDLFSKDNSEKLKELKGKILQTTEDINNKKFEEVFRI
jgi:hypothetical protein